MTDGLETDLQETPVEEVISEVPENTAPEVETLDKATVQKIIARERKKAYEKGKQEALMTLEQQSQTEQAPQQAPQQQQTFGGIPQVSHEDIQRIVAEQLPQHIQQQAQEYKNKLLVDSFVSKMQAAEQQYPGLEKKLNDLDYTKPGTRAIVEMANELENTGDIMNELVENPEKMGSLLNLIYEQPRLAQQRIASLSNSIKQNQTALAQEKSAQNPIGQMKSSVNAGITGNSEHEMSVNDLRKMLGR